MPIQFICSECGQWMQTEAKHIGGRAQCPQCGELSQVPEASDRPVADDACFYCGETIDADFAKHADANQVPTCEECRASIEENDDDIQAESLRSEQFHRTLLLLGAVAFGAFVLYWIMARVYNVFS